MNSNIGSNSNNICDMLLFEDISFQNDKLRKHNIKINFKLVDSNINFRFIKNTKPMHKYMTFTSNRRCIIQMYIRKILTNL